jgi:hypothetical protein
MKRIGILVTFALSLPLLSATSVSAGVYSDELAKCLVRPPTSSFEVPGQVAKVFAPTR